jgi:hypothetical protein
VFPNVISDTAACIIIFRFFTSIITSNAITSYTITITTSDEPCKSAESAKSAASAKNAES